ncbi:MAG: hypothetical protein GY729_04350 [Desulfobacteraceae bacterium]|nr:hypothetical protein [Desulfobacteraceae bacterium]
MIQECPNCKQILKFSDAYKEKLKTAIEKMSPGKTIKFGCPKCKKPIEIDNTGEPIVNKKAAAQMPPKKEPAAGKPPEPPSAPDISWLSTGDSQETKLAENIPTAMVLVPDDAMRSTVIEALKENDYQIYIPLSVKEAISSMRFKDYAAIVYHSGYDSNALNEQDFHKFMRQMGMDKRRNIFYILLGKEFQTLYDLDALTQSANLVVNEKEVSFLSALIVKGKADYDDLFKPYNLLLKKFGKS